MDELEIKGNWNEMKGAVKEKWGELNDDDLSYKEGQEEKLIGKIQEKTGAARDEIISYIRSLEFKKSS